MNIFNPAPLTNRNAAGLLDIFVTWHTEQKQKDVTSPVQPGTTKIMYIKREEGKVIFQLEGVSPITANVYQMQKTVTVKAAYPIQEYADKDFYVLFDANELRGMINADIEPYCVIYDDDAESLYDEAPDIEVGDGLQVEVTPDGLHFDIVPPVIQMIKPYEQHAFYSINGIRPDNGNIQIVGLGDTVFTGAIGKKRMELPEELKEQ